MIVIFGHIYLIILIKLIRGFFFIEHIKKKDTIKKHHRF